MRVHLSLFDSLPKALIRNLNPRPTHPANTPPLCQGEMRAAALLGRAAGSRVVRPGLAGAASGVPGGLLHQVRRSSRAAATAPAAALLPRRCHHHHHHHRRRRVLLLPAASAAATLGGGPAGRREQRRGFLGGRSNDSYQLRPPVNLGFCIVPQQTAYVVERLGKFSQVLEPGFCLLVPFLDKVAYAHSLKEMAVPVPGQSAITRDNVTIQIDGVLYVKIVDPYKASYGVENVLFALSQIAQTTMRSELGKISLDKTFEERELLNSKIVDSINEAAGALVFLVFPPSRWGNKTDQLCARFLFSLCLRGLVL